MLVDAILAERLDLYTMSDDYVALGDTYMIDLEDLNEAE